MLAILVGFAVISKVPATLHTPLMSGANSIHGIVLVGAMLIAAEVDDPIGYLLAFVAVAFATMNVVGGYVVTDRMLQMFRKKPAAPKPAERGRGGLGRPMDTLGMHRVLVRIAWLVGAVALRPRPGPDELAGHGPQRQPALGRRHGRRDRRDGGPDPRPPAAGRRLQRHRLGRSSSPASRSAAASACTPRGP